MFSLSSPAYRSSNTSRSSVAFAGRRQLSQQKIDEYRQKFGIDDPISPENTSKTYSTKRLSAEYWSLFGIPSSIYKLKMGEKKLHSVFNRIDRANRLHKTIVGLDHQTFISSKEAEKFKQEVDANPQEDVPYMVAIHPSNSKKVLTFITNNPNKAAELREKAQNPFDGASTSSGSNRSSIDEQRPSTSQVEVGVSSKKASPFADPKTSKKAPPPPPPRRSKPQDPFTDPE